MTPPTAGGRPWLAVVVATSGPGLGRTVEAVAALVRERRFDAEVFLPDDALARRIAESVLGDVPRAAVGFVPHRGPGLAVRSAAGTSRGRWLLVAGSAAAVSEYERLAAAGRDRDVDVILGAESHPGSRGTANALLRALLGLPYRDALGGFLLMDRPRVEPLYRRMVVDGAAGCAELLFLAHRYGLSVAEVPLTTADAGPGLAAALPRIAADAARIRWRFRRGGYHPPGRVDKPDGNVHG